LPSSLLVVLLLAVALHIVHGAAAPFHEEGFHRILVPVADALVIALLAAFVRRRPWSYSLLSSYALVGCILTLVFAFATEEDGPWATYVTVQLLLESLVLGTLFLLLRRTAIKNWFSRGSPADPVQSRREP
jgi:hypothetical protein